MSNLTPVNVEDCLDEDPALRGQNYACLSFISPEDVIKKKEVFFLEMYMKNFSLEMNSYFNRLAEKYPEDVDILKTIKDKYDHVFNPDRFYDDYVYYVNNNSTNLEKEFYQANDFQTSIRGLKIRGVFDSLREAEVRAKVLKKIDNRFNVYVAQVGCWVPFSPNPEDIENQEYAETHLNTLMKNYKENQDKKDLFYEERKRELQMLKMKDKLAEKDAWTKRREEEAAAAVPVVETTEAVVEAVSVVETTEAVEEAVSVVETTEAVVEVVVEAEPAKTVEV